MNSRVACALFAMVCMQQGRAGMPANAQVISDGSLSTQVSQSGNNFTINNGNLVGSNLFHSFSQFSVPTGGSANFNNALTVQNIFARVTGGTASNIDGLIRSNGTANLYLLNPNGILFGPNTSLNLGGSFIGTTANSIQFADGTEFSAVNPSPPPLLTMSAPIGLQMGANAGPIQVQGIPANNFFLRPPTLTLKPQQTFALVGGQVDINSANIIVPDNHVELWAMQNGTVNLPTSGNWQLSNASLSPTWGTITLRQSSNINTSGAIGGAINIRGRGLTLQDGSHIESFTDINGQGQGITVQTTEFIDLLGASDAAHHQTPGLLTSVAGSGATAGNITVHTPRLRLMNGGWLQSVNYGINFVTFAPINNATTGDIVVQATEVDVIGYNPFPVIFSDVLVYRPTAITTLVTGGQQNISGAITVNAQRVNLLDGARISTDLLGFINPLTGLPSITTGTAGNITITARESLDILGTTPAGFTSAVISSVQTLVNGQGGDIKINAGRLSVADGGTISSAISGSPIAAFAGQGKAGNITIHATDVQVSTPRIDSFNRELSGITVALGQNTIGQGGNINLTADRLQVFDGGQITSSTEGNGTAGNVNLNVNTIDVQGVSPTLINGAFLPSEITASSTTDFAAGSVNITADLLQVRDRAVIAVSNTGSGDAGNLNVNARNIFLDNGASLRAEVNGGSQGNIYLTTREVLLLRRGSNITTNAQGASTGGNINIKALAIVGLENENSDIVANAILGSGGNINITTQALLGLQFRPKLTPKSDITASSEFGINGTVQVNTIGTDPNAGLTELPVNVSDPSQKIATGCAASQGSQFVATGRGGIPQNPNQQVISDRTWDDLRDLSAYRGSQGTMAQEPPSQPPTLLQASGWQRNSDGTVDLIAAPVVQPSISSATCSGPNLNIADATLP